MIPASRADPAAIRNRPSCYRRAAAPGLLICTTAHGPVTLEGAWRGGRIMARYGRKASERVEKAMRERKRGTLRSGRSGKKVTSRKQAIAIGLSQARRAGAKVPSRSKRGSRSKSR